MEHLHLGTAITAHIIFIHHMISYLTTFPHYRCPVLIFFRVAEVAMERMVFTLVALLVPGKDFGFWSYCGIISFFLLLLHFGIIVCYYFILTKIFGIPFEFFCSSVHLIGALIINPCTRLSSQNPVSYGKHHGY